MNLKHRSSSHGTKALTLTIHVLLKSSPTTDEERSADVYAVDKNGTEGVWEAENILDAVYDSNAKFEPYTLCIEVDNSPGVLNQVITHA